MRAQVSLTPTESKKLLSKALAQMPLIKAAANEGIVVIHPSSTTLFLIEELIGKGRQQIRMDEAPLEQVAPYASEDADVPLRLAKILERRLAEEELGDLFRELEKVLRRILL